MARVKITTYNQPAAADSEEGADNVIQSAHYP
jgi:hypothetical protein